MKQRDPWQYIKHQFMKERNHTCVSYVGLALPEDKKWNLMLQQFTRERNPISAQFVMPASLPNTIWHVTLHLLMKRKKPYKCLQCSDSFSRKENLETHVISIHWFTLIKHRNEAFCDQHFLVVTIRAHDPSLYFSWCISGYGELLKRNKLKNVEKNKWMDWALFFSIWCTSVCPPNPPCSYLWTKK